MLDKRTLLIVVIFWGMPAAAQDTFCIGREPIEHDDGRYHFSHESWVRSTSGAEFYGRCIKVLPPTTELDNEWVGVLPRSLARTDRPNKGGNSFMDRQTEDASAPLLYGRGGTEIPDAALFAHSSEQVAAVGTNAETRNSSYYELIIQRVEEFGSVILDNVFSFSFLLSQQDMKSVADIDINFVSVFDGETFRYSAGSLLEMPSDYEDGELLLGFAGKALSDTLEEATGERFISIKDGDNEFGFSAPASNDLADFVKGNMLLLNSDFEMITQIPITYTLSPE